MIVIIGKYGQVARNLKKILGENAICLRRSDLDLAKSDIRNILSQYKTDIIINAAAYTQVDLAEKEAELANLVNGQSVRTIAEYAKDNDILFVHYSTDYIFSDYSNKITEEQDPNPLSIYGKSKLLGEENIKLTGGRYIMIRTSAVYDSEGSNFVKTMLKLGQHNKEIRVVDDQITSPTYAYDLAETTVKIISKIDKNFNSGIYNICNSGSTSWYGFAFKIFEMARQYNFKLNLENLKPIPTSEYPTLAIRPKYSVLSCDKLYNNYRLAMPSWQDALDRCFQNIEENFYENN